MKKKTVFTVFLILAVLIVCGCSSDAGSDDEVSKVTVTYDTKGQSFEIIKDLSVYTDSDLSNKLKFESTAVDGSQHVYTFAGESKDEIDKIYIKLPTLYQSQKTDALSSFAAKGNICKDEDGNDWFEITETWAAISASGIELDMVISPYTSTIPRTFEIIIDGEAYSGGATAMGFDETGKFTKGEIKFSLPGDVFSTLFEGEISTSGEVTLSEDVTISVTEIMKRIEVDETAFTSDVEEMVIVR